MEFWKHYNNLQNRLLASGLETNQLAHWHTESQWAIPLGPAVLLRSGALYLVPRIKSLGVLVYTLTWMSHHVTTKAAHGIPGFHRKMDTAPCQVAFSDLMCALIPLGSLGFPDSSSGFPWFPSWRLWHICPLMSIGVPWVVVHLASVSAVSVDTGISRMCLGVSDFRTAHLISENECFLLVLPTKLLSLKCFWAWDRWRESQLLALTSEAYSF